MKSQSISSDEKDMSEMTSQTLLVNSRIPSVRDNVGDTAAHQQGSDHSNGTDSHTIDGHYGRNLWEELEDAIDEKLVTSEFERTPHDFLPEGELEKILRSVAKRLYKGNLHQVISSLLLLNTPQTPREELSAVVEYILDDEFPAIKLFFTVLSSRHRDPYNAMMIFMRQRKPIRDADLPIPWSNEQVRKDVQNHPFSLLERSPRGLWPKSSISEFHDKQRRFQAAVLTTHPAKIPGQFGQNILPFTQRDSRCNRGAFGIVSKYTVHPNHYDGDKKIGSPCVVAVKELTKDNDKVAHHWANEVNALSKMNSLNQEHIVRFLTAFTRGKPEDQPEDLEYYVVFEWAEGGNLKDLWGEFPHPDRSVAFIQWIMKQLYGLCQALAAAHYLRDEDGVYRGASYRHGDLKPENILWFPWEGEDWGTLKICDWGEAKIHHEVTALRHATTTQFGTRRYEPPEVVGGKPDLDESAKDARSRLYDIWSMGCVMMECIIWLVYGLGELKRFNKSNKGDHSISEFFYEPYNEGLVIHGIVKQWLNYMMNDPFCRPGETALGDALEIISKGLLVIRLPPGDIQPEDVPGIECASVLSKELTPRAAPKPTLMVSPPLDEDSGNIYASAKITAPLTPIPVYNKVQDALAATQNSAARPGISVTLAEQPVASTKTEHLSGEPARYRATDLVSCLAKIVETSHNDRYWRAPGSPLPAPQASSGSHLVPGSIANRHAVTKQPDQGNYSHPELNRERWTFVVDNDFAARVLSNRIHIQALSGAASSTPKLCEKCAEIQKKLWSPLFKETFTTETLRHNAEAKLCDLCCLFWQACIQHNASDRRLIVFERIDSNLKISGSGTELHAISLFRGNAHSHAYSLQIGFGELPEPGHPAHLDIIRAWIADCDENHSDPVCNPYGKRRDSFPKSDLTPCMPTRLIDVGSGDDRHVRLIPTERGKDLKWIALSYRWGSRHHFSTTRANINEHMEDMSLSDLPEVFQDAIHMTRGLQCRYLWIDAICIIQGEDGDFTAESKRMENVYSGAYCVLAASYANSFRLFDTREKRAQVALGSMDSQTGVIYACEMIDNFKDHVLDGPLSQRGWVLQEHALARRTIFFTEYQTYWECGHGVRCETMAKMKNAWPPQCDEAHKMNSVSAALLGDPDFPKILKPAEHGERILRYQELYQQYSQLSLTADYDRPSAIDGLERRLIRAMGVNGGFGVLEDLKNPGLLRRSLMWYRATDTLRVINFPEGREKVPSWSWMSVSGPIHYFRLEFFGYEWKDIHSPWSKSGVDHAGNVMIAEACRLKHPDCTEAPGKDISFDIPEKVKDPYEENLLAVVLGIEKGDKSIQDKRHCVLIVEPISQQYVTDYKRCRRVGAGIVTGNHLSEKWGMWSII
ncbi:HET-domain-containing protein [Curvularia clavata]|uniref:HET-domain-containing protein n=1 Tax=Curvularia clavata TaxID=95742 RepID=A0A9Q8Z914_CURCL|nr:HET-domain-containing protein [Curvularia clavata]